ncbi:MAG: septum site-determining protein MinC [Buchnera aphidicola (Floraphis choui)]
MKILPLELKESIFKILVLHLQTDSTELICQELRKKIQMSPKFFKNLPILVNIQNSFNIKSWNNIKKLIISFNFYIIGVSGCYSDTFKNEIIQSGLPILSEEKSLIHHIKKYRLSSSYYTDLNKSVKTKIVNFPVRSGQKIYAVNSDLIIINNVNSGAEIIADGNIHVYGHMRGRVLAGAKGDTTCQIFCMNFFSELVSIAGEYLLSNHFSSDFIGHSVRIYIMNKKLNILKLN